MVYCTFPDAAANQDRFMLPEWMFDRGLCVRMKLVVEPEVDVSGLQALRALLGCCHGVSREQVVGRRHLVQIGGAYEAQGQNATTITGVDAGPVSTAAGASKLVEPGRRDSNGGGTVAGPAVDTGRLVAGSDRSGKGGRG